MGSLKKFPHCTSSKQPPTGQNKLLLHKQIHLPSIPQTGPGEMWCFPWTEGQIASFISWHYNTLSSSFLGFWPALKWQVTVCAGVHLYSAPATQNFGFSHRGLEAGAHTQVLSGTQMPNRWSPPEACVLSLLRITLRLRFPSWGIRVTGLCQNRQPAEDKHCTHTGQVQHISLPALLSHG